jgi:ribosome-associated toxin RatA of RatAB toxin-antitoxin module
VTQVQKTVLVTHPAERMYALVDNVAHYPAFLPWCAGAEIESRANGVTRATLVVNFKGIRQRFTTDNTGTPHTAIAMKLVTGPFRALQGSWRFHPLGAEGCRVEFELEYEFSSRLLERMVGPVFHFIADTMVDAFVRRADQQA